MAVITTHVKSPRALAHTRRWAEPGSKSAALWAGAQGVVPGGNTRPPVYMSPYPPYAASGEGCWITGDRRGGDAAARPGLVVPAADDTELEGLIETVAAVLEMERSTGGGSL